MAIIDNIKAYYKLDNEALTKDSTGNGYTLLNPINVVEGLAKLGSSSADFGANNTTKYLYINNNFGIAGAGDITVSFWVKLNREVNDGESWAFYLFASKTTADRYMQLYYYRSGATYTTIYDGAARSVSQTGALGTTNWTHFVMTRTGGSMYAYKNGSAVGNNTLGTGTFGWDRFIFGAQGRTPSYTTSCLIDEVGVWSRALSSAEVSSLYNSGVGLSYPFTAPITDTTGFFNFNN